MYKYYWIAYKLLIERRLITLNHKHVSPALYPLVWTLRNRSSGRCCTRLNPRSQKGARVQIFVRACDLKCRWASRAAISRLSATAIPRTPKLQPFRRFHSPFVGERDRKGKEGEQANIRFRFKLSNWISATETLRSGPKFTKRVRNANRGGEDRDRAERIGLFESSLDFQSCLQTCANIASTARTSLVFIDTLSVCSSRKSTSIST